MGGKKGGKEGRREGGMNGTKDHQWVIKMRMGMIITIKVKETEKEKLIKKNYSLKHERNIKKVTIKRIKCNESVIEMDATKYIYMK